MNQLQPAENKPFTPQYFIDDLWWLISFFKLKFVKAERGLSFEQLRIEKE